MPEKVIVFGAGGHAKVVIDAIHCEGRYDVAFVADGDHSKVGTTILGYTVRDENYAFSVPESGVARVIVAIGNNAARAHIADVVVRHGLMLASVVHPRATIARSARVGEGTLIMPGCIINADARIGKNVVINTGAVIEHDCEIGDAVHVAPNATLCGGAVIGAGTCVGAGATLAPLVRIGVNSCIGAGSTVLRDVPDGVTAAGSPCRILRKKT